MNVKQGEAGVLNPCQAELVPLINQLRLQGTKTIALVMRKSRLLHVNVVDEYHRRGLQLVEQK